MTVILSIAISITLWQNQVVMDGYNMSLSVTSTRMSLRLLEKAYAEGSPMLIDLNVDPALDILRSDPDTQTCCGASASQGSRHSRLNMLSPPRINNSPAKYVKLHRTTFVTVRPLSIPAGYKGMVIVQLLGAAHDSIAIPVLAYGTTSEGRAFNILKSNSTCGS